MTDVAELKPKAEGRKAVPRGAKAEPPDREEIEARIDRLRRERGAAVLDGKPFDDRQLMAAEAELQAVEDAEAEARRRSLTASDDAQVKARADAIKAFVAVSKEWLDEIDEAEAMARAMVAALKAAEVRRAEVQRLSSVLTGSVPTLAGGHVQEDRRSRALCALLASLTGRGQFGDVQFMTLAAAGDAWATEEKALIAGMVQQLSGGNNG